MWTDGQRYGQTDLTTPIVDFRHFTNPPNKYKFKIHYMKFIIYSVRDIFYIFYISHKTNLKV